MKNTRGEVFAVIDSERNYQDGLDHTRTDGCAKGVGDYLSLIRTYLRQAEDKYAFNPGNVEALHSIRKIAGIAVACMEQHGAHFRTIPEVKPCENPECLCHKQPA